MCGLSLIVGSGGYSVVAVSGLLLLLNTGSRACRLRQLQYSGSVVVLSGLVALRHVESSQTRDQTRVPCIGRWILNHWTTKEV